MTLFCSGFNETWSFKTDFLKKNQILNLTEIRPVGDELFHADRQTDRQTDRGTDSHEEANSRISQFCERK